MVKSMKNEFNLRLQRMDELEDLVDQVIKVHNATADRVYQHNDQLVSLNNRLASGEQAQVQILFCVI